MAVFDYQDTYSKQLIHDALIIEGVNLGAVTDTSNTYTFSGEDGWKILDGTTLNYRGDTNPYGAFYGESKFFKGAECNVLGKYDNQGNLTSIGISFWGTGTYANAPNAVENNMSDIASDILSGLIDGFADSYTIKAYNNLLTSVAKFASANGLSGSDVIISGHSLGGLAVNSMATSSSTGAWDSFYETSNYIAIASPTQNLADDKVLNIGYENDPVFRILNGHSLTIESLFSHDTPRETCTNNIVTFNDFHAGLGLTSIFGCISIANPFAWASHRLEDYIDGITRIMDSEVYDFTNLDSNIIISTLSESNRTTTWVSDLNKSIAHKGSTFIIGTESDDLIQGGSKNDYLCGGAGNDSFKDHSGYNVIYGGSGTNTYFTESRLSDFTFSHDANGTLYFKFSTGDITRAEDIQYVNACYKSLNLLFTHVKSYDTYSVTDTGLEAESATYNYASSYYASTENSFTISSTANGSWLFSGDSQSNITICGNKNNIVSGISDDIINLDGYDNTMLFYGDFGNDTIYNLSSTDSLIFMANQYIGANDSYLNHLSFVDNSTILTFGDSNVTLYGVDADMLSSMNIVLA